MKKVTKLILEDQVNCKFTDLEASTRRKMVDALKFMPGYARHTPAFKMGRWDGYVNFATIGGGTSINLLDKVLPIVLSDGYHVDIVDNRKPFSVDLGTIEDDYLSDYCWPDHHRLAGEAIILAEHQVRAVNTYLQNHQCLMEIATGAGKTILTAALAKRIEEKIPEGRTLTIVPSKSLVENTEDDFKMVDLDCGVFFGDRKEWGHKHIVATWQSLSVFAKKSKGRAMEIDSSLKEYLRGVVAVIVDEAHSSKAVELKNLLSDPKGCAHVPLRWGMTGTIPDEEYDLYAILGVIGPKMGEITAKELQEAEVLSTCEINILQTDEAHLKFEDYHQANAFLVSDRDRMRWLASKIEELQKTGNVLVLHEKLVTAEELSALMPNMRIVDGSMSLKKRNAIYKSVNDDTNDVICATYGVAAVGINIPALHHLVLIEAGKSIVRVIQSVGRGLRRTNKKLHVEIWDVCSNNKFSKKHMKDRIKRYEKAQYPFRIIQIES